MKETLITGVVAIVLFGIGYLVSSFFEKKAREAEESGNKFMAGFYTAFVVIIIVVFSVLFLG